MANSIDKIQTSSGYVTFNYNALDNLPQSDTSLTKNGSFADAKAVGDRIAVLTNEVKGSNYNSRITALEDILTKNGLSATTNISSIINNVDSQGKRISSLESLTSDETGHGKNIKELQTNFNNVNTILSKNQLTASTDIKSSVDSLDTFALTSNVITQDEFKEMLA